MANEATEADVSATKVRIIGSPFKSGAEWKGNAAGRPKGARSRLGDAFLTDMLAAWTEKGRDAIDRVIEERPHEFIKAVAQILPKEVNVRTEVVQELSDDELTAALIALRSVGALAHAGKGSEEAARH